MMIGGFQKLTLLDYPNHVACIVFTTGCNFNCGYCQNSTLINSFNFESIDENIIFSYLSKRKGIIDGVVITGGEPTVQKGLKGFIKKVKDLGFKVKLDTNGYNDDVLKDLIENNLLDYVAMDIKETFEKYYLVIGRKIDTTHILNSINILENSNIPHEYRTTIIKEYHTINDIVEIISYFNNNTPYYLQNFKNSSNVLDTSLHGFSYEELEAFNTCIKEKRTIKIR